MQLAYPARITGVTERALVATGQWPTAEGAVDGLVAALTAAADQEPELERQGKLRGAAAVLSGMAREIAVGWVTGAIPTP